MGDILKLALYTVMLMLVFILFGTMIHSCGNKAVDTMTDTASEVTETITEEGGKIVAKAESVLEDAADEFESGDINYAEEGQEIDYSEESLEPSYMDESSEPVYQVEEEPEAKKPATTTTTTTTVNAGGNRGSYLLITGNYSQESNAKAMVERLNKMGYRSAEKVIFDGSRYYTVIAGRYESMGAANSAKADLGNIDSYVQKRRL